MIYLHPKEVEWMKRFYHFYMNLEATFGLAYPRWIAERLHRIYFPELYE